MKRVRNVQYLFIYLQDFYICVYIEIDFQK